MWIPLALLALVVADPPTAAAYKPGDTVVVVRVARLKVDGHPVGIVTIGFALDVLQVEGERMWVESAASGWLDSADVIPLERAVEHFTKAIARDPLNENYYQARGKVYTAAGQFAAAIRDLDEAIALVPSWPGFYLDRGNAYLAKGDYDKGLADFSQAVEFGPDDPVGYNHRGVALLHKGNYARAIADYEEARRLSADYAEPLRNLAQLLACCPEAKWRDGRKALAYAQAACELSKWRNPAGLHYLACAHAESGNFEEAVRWEEKAIGMTPPARGRNLKIMQAALARFKSGRPYHELPRVE